VFCFLKEIPFRQDIAGDIRIFAVAFPVLFAGSVNGD